jgi:DeoR/GlpR family transcriptional regulator of sugar metabolism
MHALERRRRIIAMLREVSFLTVEDAGKALGASPATIRRDFADLAGQALVVRGHGGVHRLEDAPVMGGRPVPRRIVSNPEGRDRICRAAAGLIQSGDAVIIDGGEGTAHLAGHLCPLARVVTNSLPLASALSEPANGRATPCEVNVTGGFLYPRSEVLLGPQTILSLRQYHAAWTILAAGGVTDDGIFDANNLVVDTQREMIARAEKVAVLADHARIDRAAMVKVCDLAEIDVLITDAPVPPALEEILRQADVTLIVAD